MWGESPYPCALTHVTMAETQVTLNLCMALTEPVS